MELTQLSTSFYVTGQLEAADFAELARLGIKSVINNRPDGEADDQPDSASLAAAAASAGLAYHHVPVVSKSVSQSERNAFSKAMNGIAEPVCAFCRTGTRAAICWAISELDEQSKRAIVDTIVGAGFSGDAVEQQLGSCGQAPDAGGPHVSQ